MRRARRASPRATTKSRRWSIRRRIRNRSRGGSAARSGRWTTAATPAAGSIAPVKEAPTKLGEIIAIREGDGWSLAVVRRMQRHQVDEVTVGVEIIATRLVRVLLRNWVTPTMSGRAGRRSAVLRHLPARAPGQPADGAAQPDRPGRQVRARRHGRARYRQRALPHPLHADARAPGGLGVDAVHRGAQADALRALGRRWSGGPAHCRMLADEFG